MSQATVSLVLGGKERGSTISDETRNRVLDVARKLGYAHDPAARRLAAARNNLLGVFSFTATFPTDVQHSYYPFLVGVEQEAAARGYDLVLFTGSSTGGAGAEVPDALSRVRLADGCLFLGRHAPTAELRRLVDDGFPVVHVGRRQEPEGLAWVGADYVSASREVVAQLAAQGHRRIVLLREDDEATASTDRERGIHEGLADAGLETGPWTVFRTADPARPSPSRGCVPGARTASPPSSRRRPTPAARGGPCWARSARRAGAAPATSASPCSAIRPPTWPVNPPPPDSTSPAAGWAGPPSAG